MTESNVIDAVRRYLTENFLYATPDLVLEPEESLLEARILDSLGVMELVEWVSVTFDLVVEDHEITVENFASLGAIARFALRKRRAVA